MTLASFEGRFGRMEVGTLIPKGDDLETHLAIGSSHGDGEPLPLEGFGVEISRVPPRWLRDGDEVTIEIERIGALTNQVRAAARNGGTR